MLQSVWAANILQQDKSGYRLVTQPPVFAEVGLCPTSPLVSENISTRKLQIRNFVETKISRFTVITGVHLRVLIFFYNNGTKCSTFISFLTAWCKTFQFIRHTYLYAPLHHLWKNSLLGRLSNNLSFLNQVIHVDRIFCLKTIRAQTFTVYKSIEEFLISYKQINKSVTLNCHGTQCH